MRIPRILTHVLDHESTTVTLGFMVFLAATGGMFYKRIIDADTWLWCVFIASLLVGGKLVSNSLLEALQIKTGAKAPPAAPTSEKPKETP